eukprot:3757604-Pyramimonas_sp.AAC.1
MGGESCALDRLGVLRSLSVPSFLARSHCLDLPARASPGIAPNKNTSAAMSSAAALLRQYSNSTE